MAEVTQADKDWAVDMAHALGLTAEQFTSGAADVLVKLAAEQRGERQKPESTAATVVTPEMRRLVIGIDAGSAEDTAIVALVQGAGHVIKFRILPPGASDADLMRAISQMSGKQ